MVAGKVSLNGERNVKTVNVDSTTNVRIGTPTPRFDLHRIQRAAYQDWYILMAGSWISYFAKLCCAAI